MSPIANNLVPRDEVEKPEISFPLHVMTCSYCALVQIPEIASPEQLFKDDYVYFSSYSTSWLEHASEYVKKMTNFLNLEKDDLVLEVASNDGYLLQYFQELGIEVLGIEPALNAALAAESKGIPTVKKFFGSEVANQLVLGHKPRLMLGNNVLAHVPDIHDFIEGFAQILSKDGVITFEFPHLNNLIKYNQFDTIYHEHYSYLSLTALCPIIASHGLKIFDVEKIQTHGGSLRVFLGHIDSKWVVENTVEIVLKEESELDPREERISTLLQSNALNIKLDLISELVKCKKEGLEIAAYGAAAKGNTLLNYSGIDSDLINYVVDLNPHKQNKYLPGSRIPVVGTEKLLLSPPDILLVLPWNLAEEVKLQVMSSSGKKMRFLKAVPKLEYF